MASGPTSVTGHADQVDFPTVATWAPTLTPDAQTTPGQLAGNTSVVPDPVGRTLYAISNNGSWVGGYDLTTLKGRGQGLATDGITFAAPTNAGGTLLTATVNSSNVPAIETFTANQSGVAHLSTAALTSLAGTWIVGVDQAPDGYLYAMLATWENPDWVPASIHIAKIDITQLGQGSATVDWNVALPTCQQPVASNNRQAGLNGSVRAPGIGYVPDDHSVYFACATVSSPSGGLSRPPLPAGVGRLEVPTDGTAPASNNFTLFPHTGDFAPGDSFFDPVSRRLVVTVGTGPTTGLVFDAPTHAYVGNINAGGNRLLGSGVDLHTGQFLAMSPHPDFGFMASFFRSTPAAQPYYFPKLTPNPVPPDANIAVDPATDRAFVLEAEPGAINYFFRVLRYTGAPYVPPIPNNPDANTNNLPETPVTTGHTYSASAQGYGVVGRLVGGTDALVTDFANFESGVSVVAPGTREIRLANINQLSLGLDEASAGAIAADRDIENTGADMNAGCSASSNLPTSVPGTSQVTNQCTWPFQQATCANFGGSAVQNAQTAYGGVTTVTCDVAHQSASVDTLQSGVNILGLSVGNAESTASVAVNTVDGTVSTITSTAKGISVDNGALQIGEVTTVTTAKAHGRPGSATTTFTRTIKNVVIQGTPICTTQCDPGTIAAEINTQFTGILRLDLPSPDPHLGAGSPGGYQAIVRRPAEEQIQEEAQNDQAADRTEVPGVELTLYLGDNQKPARLVAYLAGVEGEARYGIYPIDQIVADNSGAGGLSSSSGSFGTASGSIDGITPGGAVGSSTPRPSTRTGTTPGARSLIAGLLPPGGWSWAMAHPLDALKLLFMWAVLLSPIYVSARRWLLLQRNRVLKEALS